MKKTIACWFALAIFLLSATSAAFADAEQPRLLLKSFLPLPDNKLVVYGKVMYLDPEDLQENLENEHLELFFNHRAKDLPLTITVASMSIQTQTNKVGDFIGIVPAATVLKLQGETSVSFTSSKFPAFHETARFNLPTHPLYLIVSDIDDSVLESSEGKMLKAIANSLFRPVHRREAVKGTPEIYRSLIRGTQGVDSLLVFLSGSPVYLAPRLEIFFSDKAFPDHALILQNVGPKENIWDRWFNKDVKRNLTTATMEYKLLQLAKLFKWYPELQVILLGDSLADDPEIYQKMAEEFPGKVRLVVIRNITKQPFDAPRYAGLKKAARLIVWNDPILLRQALANENIVEPQGKKGMTP
ncbi:MAG TPA: DUF2183 domain-containing protein [Candidatus Ozemobacteraceae bacterium]|nr:DUF2183 domain-containing protein [Candidatus Ozemobacteraceae bacterium]